MSIRWFRIMAHKSRNAPTKKVKEAIGKSAKKHSELIKRLQEEERLMLTEYESSVNTGFKGSWDFVVDSSSDSGSPFVTDRDSEAFALNVYVNPISTQRKARKLQIFGE